MGDLRIRKKITEYISLVIQPNLDVENNTEV
jgi:hypothetical protein